MLKQKVTPKMKEAIETQTANASVGLFVAIVSVGALIVLNGVLEVAGVESVDVAVTPPTTKED